ncbi:hypothetical protein [Devosia sp. Root105]|uniref:hypothetical protein n=1 Tax=Devosia sp. Root105 TaxID=1736423 RepID=UPI000A4EE2CA|nr:hypothetical protein [Devosia sp. Root105]
MNRIRPLAGALLAALMLSPLTAAVLPVVADEVDLLLPGGPTDGTGPAAGTGPADELVPPVTADSGDGDSSSDYVPEPMLQTRHFGLTVQLSCAVSGKPNAIVVVNHSAEELPPGTRIKWQLKSEGKRGFFALLNPLAGGETLVADNVLDSAASEAADCVARVI